MSSSVIGGAVLPQAPQFFTMPQTEDRATVAPVKEVAREIGSRLKALKPDLWIIFANDHAEQFFHNVAPAFTSPCVSAAAPAAVSPERPPPSTFYKCLWVDQTCRRLRDRCDRAFAGLQ